MIACNKSATILKRCLQIHNSLNGCLLAIQRRNKRKARGAYAPNAFPKENYKRGWKKVKKNYKFLPPMK